MIEQKIISTWQIIRYTCAALFIIVGADKFFDLICCWRCYTCPLLTQQLGSSLFSFMRLFGGVQIVAGILLFTRWIKYGILIQLTLLIGILINLLIMQDQAIVTTHDVFFIIFVVTLYGLNSIVLDLHNSN